MDKNSVWRELFLRTRKVVIEQGFDNVRGKVNVDAVVLLAAGHIPAEIVNRCSKVRNGDTYTVFSGSIQSTSIEPSWSGLTIV